MSSLLSESSKWWFSPYINHFVSADTIIPDEANPQNWDRYSYVSNNPLRYTDPTGHMLEEGGGSCGANDHTCWQNSAKAWDHASQTIDKKAFGGFQQIYFAAQAGLAYNIADGASPDVIQASLIHIEDAYLGLLTNGYAGQKIGVSTAFDSSGFESLGLATFGINLVGMFVPTGMTLSPDEGGGGGGRPQSNYAQNQQFRGAVQEIQSQIGRNLTKDEIRQLHDSIHHLEDPGFWDIVNEGLNLFGE